MDPWVNWMLWLAVTVTAAGMVLAHAIGKEGFGGPAQNLATTGKTVRQVYDDLVNKEPWRFKPESKYNFSHTYEYGVMSVKRYKSAF